MGENVSTRRNVSGEGLCDGNFPSRRSEYKGLAVNFVLCFGT